MNLSTASKKMIVFLHRENPLWNDMRLLTQQLAHRHKIADPKYLTGLPSATYYNWIAGEHPNTDRALKMFAHIGRHIEEALGPHASRETRPLVDGLKERAVRFRDLFLDDKSRVYEAARILAMPLDQCQMIIDSVIYKRLPLLQGVYYDGNSPDQVKAAEEHFQKVGGIYYLWVRRHGAWRMQCPVRVRYLLEVGDGRFLRCKMNFPILRPEAHASVPAPSNSEWRPHWEFDGPVVVRDQHLFWTFERRERDRYDQFHFTTDRGKTVNGLLTLKGTYLSTDQDPRQTIVTGDVLLQRIAPAAAELDDEAITHLMWNGPRELGLLQQREVQCLWEMYHRDDDVPPLLEAGG